MKAEDEKLKKIFTDLIEGKLGLYRAIAIKIVNSPADADDAVQTALFKGWTRRNDFKSDTAALSGWIARIVVTTSYDIVRKKIRETQKLAGYEILNNDENPAIQKLDEAIAALPESHRETVHIAILSDLPGVEAARLLGCSANTLYQRIHKAKLLLRETMWRLENE